MAFEAEQLLVLVPAESPLQLAWSFPPSSLTSALDINRLEAQGADCVVILPDATVNPTAQTIRFYNVGNHSVEIQFFGGGFALTLEIGEYYEFSLIDNSTTFGTWIIVPYIAGAVNISNFTVASDSIPSLIITNGNVTATGQTVTIAQPPALLGLVNPAASNLSAKGVLAYDPSGGNPIYYSRTLQSGDGNVTILNPDGTTGDPTFALSPTMSGLTSIGVGSLSINTDGLTTVGSDISLSTGGSAGSISLNGTTIDPVGNAKINGSLVVNGGLYAPQLPIAWARMTDTTTGETNTLTTQDAFNAVLTQKVSGVGGTYTCTMPVAALNTYYGVHISCGTSSTHSPTLFAKVIYSSITANAFDFVVTDIGDTIVSEVPNSLTITVFSTGDSSGSLVHTVKAFTGYRQMPNALAVYPSGGFPILLAIGTISNYPTSGNLLVRSDKGIQNTGSLPMTVLFNINVTVLPLSNAGMSLNMYLALNNVSSNIIGAPVQSILPSLDRTITLPLSVITTLAPGDFVNLFAEVIADTDPTMVTEFVNMTAIQLN